MPCRLSTLASAASLVLCAATCVLWVRSYAGPPFDSVTVRDPPDGCGAEMLPGRVVAFLQRDRPSYRDGDPSDVQVRWAGFLYLQSTGDGVRRWNVGLPAWLLAAAAAVPPVGWAARRVAAAWRRGAGHCLDWGYDLRATPGRCPECGAGPADLGRRV